MKLSVIFCAALAALAEAKANFTNSAADFGAIVAGQPLKLTWSGGEAPYTITLQNGDPADLKDVMVIAQGLTTEDFTWIPLGTMASGIYTLKIVDGTNVPNWSVRWNFQTTGTTATGSSSSGSSSSTTGSSSSTPTGSSSTTTGSSSTTTGSSSTGSRTSTTSGTKTTATTTPTTTPANTNDAMSAKSPLALVLVTIAALLYFN